MTNTTAIKRDKSKTMNIIAQELACKYMQANGYKILFRNYECALGKIHLITKKDGYLIFAQVVLDSNKKRQELIKEGKRTSAYYVKRYGITNILRSRFDVVSVRIVPDKEPVVKIETVGVKG